MAIPAERSLTRPEVIPAIHAFNRSTGRKALPASRTIDISGNLKYEAAPMGMSTALASNVPLQILAGMTQISFACVKCLDDGSGWNRLATQITKREETP